MRCINLLFIFFIVEKFSSSTTTETPETTIVSEQINLLKAKLVRLRNLKDLTRKSTLFRNWEGTCTPLEMDSQLRCKTVEESNCICTSANKEKVNWFTADAFCDYYGMNLISFPLEYFTVEEIDDFISDRVWTSANDVITRRLWVFRKGYFLSQEKENKWRLIQGLDESTLKALAPFDGNTSWRTPPTCISSTQNYNETKFYPESCLEKRLFICQHFIV